MQTLLPEAEATRRRIDTDVNQEDVPAVEDTDQDHASDVLEVEVVDRIRDRRIEIGELRDVEVPLQTVLMSLLKSHKSSTAFIVPFRLIQSQTANITFFSNIQTCYLDARLVINKLHSKSLFLPFIHTLES